MIRVAGDVASQVRRNEIFARLGGDGFAILAPDTGEDVLRVVADRITRTIGQLRTEFEGETLRDAIVAAAPAAKGLIDRLGNYTVGANRYLIHPYLPYRQVEDLMVFHRCVMAKTVPVAQRPRCFVIDDDEAQRRNPKPLALKSR